MKKIFNYLCLAAFATAIFAGCSKNDSPENLPDSSVIKVSFTAKSADPLTKTYFGNKESAGYPTVWSENQKVSISLNYGSAKQATVTPSATGKTASFTADIDATGATAPYVFYALSPAAAAISWNSDYESVQVDFPATQTPTNGSVDEVAHIMTATSSSFTTIPDADTKVSLSFSHLAAYGKFQFRDLPETVTINSIELTAQDPVAGRFYFYPETGELVANSVGNTVSLDLSSVTIDKNNTTDFWFSFKPVNLEGKTLKVSVNTDNGKYEKTITFPTGKGNFQAGKVAAFTINMSGITPGSDKVFKIVTDKKQLLPGSKVIIVAKDAAVAVSTTQNGNNRATASVVKSSDLKTITNPGDAVQIFELEAGTGSYTVAFKCENGAQAGKYLGSAETNNNYLRSFDSKNGNTSFSVTIQDGSTVLLSNGDYPRYIKYNSTNTPPIFAAYTSGQNEVVLYSQEGTGEGSSLINDPPCPTPTISYDATTKTVTINCSAADATVGYTTDGSTPSQENPSTIISSSLPIVFGITATTTIKAIAGAPGYTMSEMAEKECVVSTGTETWVKKEITELQDGDVFVFVGNNGSNYALSNDKGTGNPPTAVAVTVSGNALASTPAANIQWVAGVTYESGNPRIVFYTSTAKTQWLYCTSTNNGVRVGTNSNNVFACHTSKYLIHMATMRYVGIYSSQDWRCYTSNGGNISGQTFSVYVKQ